MIAIQYCGRRWNKGEVSSGIGTEGRDGNFISAWSAPFCPRPAQGCCYHLRLCCRSKVYGYPGGVADCLGVEGIISIQDGGRAPFLRR